MSDEIKEMLNNADSSTKFKIVDEDGTEKEMNIAGFIEQLLNDNKHLLNYVTNLQEENEEFRLLKERYQLIKEIYKERIDKAIEYIKSPKICIDIRKTDGTLDFVSTDELLNILGGEE